MIRLFSTFSNDIGVLQH